MDYGLFVGTVFLRLRPNQHGSTAVRRLCATPVLCVAQLGKGTADCVVRIDLNDSRACRTEKRLSIKISITADGHWQFNGMVICDGRAVSAELSNA